MSSFSFFPFHLVLNTELDRPLRHITGKSQRLRHVASRQRRERDWTGEEVHSSRHPPTARTFQSGRRDLKCQLPHRDPAAPYQRTSLCHWETWGQEWNVSVKSFSYSFFFNKKKTDWYLSRTLCAVRTVWSLPTSSNLFMRSKKKRKRKRASILVRKFNGRSVAYMFLEGCVITEGRSDHVI